MSCGGSEPWNDPGPRDVFDAFLMHYFRGESELAFELVAPDDRAALTAPLETAGDIPAETKPEPHEMLVVAGVHNVYDVSRMELARPLERAPRDGENVEIVLHHQDGTRSSARLVWIESRWYVDLPLEGEK